MEASDWTRVKDIFSAAVELIGAEREAHVAGACAGNPEIEAEVRNLLAGHERAGNFLSSPAVPFSPPDELPPLFAPGQEVAGRFRILRFIARGGMGDVYEAEDLKLGERIALKTIRPQLESEARMDHLKHEIQAARRVTHPNVCRTYDLAEHGDPPLTIATMELLQGPTLSQQLREQGPFSRRDALPWIRRIAAGLQAAHDAGVIHRDLKPGNVILSGGVEGARPVITDFGLALSGISGSVPSARRAGTPRYMAPEQLEGKPVTPATDVYAFGVMIAEMVGARPLDSPDPSPPSGTPPFEGAISKKKLGPWRRVVRRCLERDPGRRYQRPIAVVSALRRAARFTPRRMVLLAVFAVAAVFGLWRLAAYMPSPQPPQWLLLAELDNRTGEPQLDGSFLFLLERELSNSQQIYVAPRIRIGDTLRLMNKDPESRIDEALGHEVCLRDGGIELVVGSRAERAGTGCRFTVWVTEAASGRVLGSSTQLAGTLGAVDVGDAVRRLALAVRKSAGERGTERPAIQTEMQHVTTPSLRACQLYSQAYQEVMRRKWDLSAQFAREAIAEDPKFAMAHLWLAYMLYKQHKGRPSWLPELEQAVALGDSISNRERLFLLAVQEDLNRNYEKAVLAYRRMLDSYPDDFMARDNLIGVLNGQNRTSEFIQENFRAADLRPTEWSLQYTGIVSAMVFGELDQARKFRDRFLRMQAVNSDPVSPKDPPEVAATLFLHELWLAGRLEELRNQLAKTNHAPTCLTMYETLGRLHDAGNYYDKLTPGVARECAPVALAYLRDDEKELRSSRGTLKNPCLDPLTMLLDIRADSTLTERENILSDAVSCGFQPGWLARQAIEGRFSSLSGDALLSSRQIELFGNQSLRWVTTGTPEVYLLRLGLARAYESAGDDAGAQHVLEEVDFGPIRTFSHKGLSVAAYWHRLRYERARYLRKLGQIQEAQEIENGLKRDLRIADPDHPILVRLGESERRPFRIY